jgi:hypothetical protein
MTPHFLTGVACFCTIPVVYELVTKQAVYGRINLVIFYKYLLFHIEKVLLPIVLNIFKICFTIWTSFNFSTFRRPQINAVEAENM